jgi:hypothetical protein
MARLMPPRPSPLGPIARCFAISGLKFGEESQRGTPNSRPSSTRSLPSAITHYVSIKPTFDQERAGDCELDRAVDDIRAR